MYSMMPCLSELNARLLFDGAKSSDRNVFARPWNRNAARLYGMLELLVTACLRNLKPSIFSEPRDDFTAVHRSPGP